MTTIDSHSIVSRYSCAISYSGRKPCEVRSPEMTTRSGPSSLTSAIARSSRSGRKNCCPQWRSESWTIVKVVPVAIGQLYARSEEPANRVEAGGGREPGGRDRQQPGEHDVARDAPAHGREPPRRACSHHRSGGYVRRRDRIAEVAGHVQDASAGELRGEAVLRLHAVHALADGAHDPP